VHFLGAFRSQCTAGGRSSIDAASAPFDHAGGNRSNVAVGVDVEDEIRAADHETGPSRSRLIAVPDFLSKAVRGHLCLRAGSASRGQRFLPVAGRHATGCPRGGRAEREGTGWQRI